MAIFRYTGSALLSFLTVPGAYYLMLGVGYDIFASYGYVPIDPEMDAESIRARLRQSGAVQPELRSELDSFDFELLWVHEPTRTGFIGFRPL